jgi:MGT family glycosyltransferase
MTRHFLFLSIADRGHTFPNLAVVSELVRRGHRVTYVTGAEVAGLVEAAGAAVITCESSYAGADLRAVANDPDPSTMPMMLLDDSIVMLDAALDRLADDVPDLVACDIAAMQAGRVLGHVWQRPTVQLTPFFASNEKFVYTDAMLEADGISSEVVPDFFEAFFGGFMEKLSGLLGSHGLPSSFENMMKIPEFSLVNIPREFQYDGESFDERFAFVGPCLGERAFLGEWQAPADGLPVVLVSLGTVFNRDPEFFRNCVQAFTGQPVHAVISLGNGVDPDSLGDLPANIEVHRWVPHLSVLEHAEVFVTHGGAGSVMEALYWGRPMMAVPQSRDTRPTAMRLAELGLGRLVEPWNVTAEGLRGTVLDLLADEETRRRAAGMREHVRAAGGTVRAADVLEARLEAGPEGSR